MTHNQFAEDRYVYQFTNRSRMSLHAATLDRRGKNLPQSGGDLKEWVLTGQLVVGPIVRPSLGIDISALKVGIEQDGFYMWNADYEEVTGSRLLPLNPPQRPV